MSLSRKTLVQILSEFFDKDVQLKKKCLLSSKRALMGEGLTKRIFDEFPCLLEEEEVKKFSQDFLNILESVHVKESDREFILENKTDMEKIKSWELAVVQRAMTALLDEQAHIKRELQEFLEWKADLSQQQTCHIVSAYVGAVNQEVMHALDQDIQKHSNAMMALCNYVNKNLGCWLIDYLIESRKFFDKTVMDIVKTQQHEQEWIRIKKRRIAIVASIATAVGLFALGCAVVKQVLDRNVSTSSSNGAHQASSLVENNDLQAEQKQREWERKR